MSACHYDGPVSTNDGSRFMVHATLEPGAEKSFSGIRVLIGCKNTQELAALVCATNGATIDFHVKANLPLQAISDDSSPFLGFGPSFDKPPMAINDRALARQRHRGDSSAATALPLCTLVFEVVEKVDRYRGPVNRVNLILHPPEAMESHSLRTLYDHVEPCAPSSNSAILFLRINDTLRGSLTPKVRSRIICARSAPMAIPVHGVRILPPPASRKPFINLPIELLHMIFEEAVKDKFQYSWRATLISFALVCRAWRPALDHLFEHFGPFNAALVRPDAPQLAMTIRRNPELGMKIRVFDPSHFRIAKEKMGFEKAIITILQNAKMVRELWVSDTHRTLARDFVRALCSSPYVESFRTTVSKTVSEDRYILSLDDIIQCLSHWPRVRTVSIYGFTKSLTTGVDGLPTPSCSIRNLSLQNGFLTFPQLRLFTASSLPTLQNVTLRNISGLSNEDLRTWLVDVVATLTSLGIQFTPLSRRSDDEEYAVDALLPKMAHLRHLELEGDVASELVLSRYAPCCERGQPSRREGSTLTVDNMPGVDVHGFVGALKATRWARVTATNLVLREEKMKLKAEATKIAKDRNILLMI